MSYDWARKSIGRPKDVTEIRGKIPEEFVIVGFRISEQNS